MSITSGGAPDSFIVNNREYQVEYARLILARSTFKRKSNIIIPDEAQRKYAPTKGILIAVGASADEYWKELIGKEVVFARFAGDWVKLDEDDSEDDMIYICQDEDVLITRLG